jgi:hypoxanthine phosphoribosyltransferase
MTGIKHVLIVEDIIDTGHTLQQTLARLAERQPASLRVCTLLDKPSRRRVPVSVDYVGFQIEDVFVIGYGMDDAQQYRHLPYIGVKR